ncbi:uncharacterized protein LOC116302277 [Actinia tenebrosa]|uniref:Uncharacterized protein LOC116302277 n=1 Tax=Actinia tenebrosa TaxID=6105 RepID=A0A6P8IKQ9_ACTTE|nr:uncharacterized protein LOC116302277 [Actinia tenebrosa]
MSRSYAVKGSYASQSGARPRRTVNNDGMLQQERAEFSGDQQDESTQEAQANPPANERYQRREAYTVIAPKEDKRQHLLRIQKEEEETARRRKEEKAKKAIRITPRPVGGPKISQREFIEHQQKAADKSPTARAIEMRV